MDLGNLYFNVGVKDNTAKDAGKVKKELEKTLKVKAVITPVLNSKSIKQAIAGLQKQNSYKVYLDAAIHINSVRKSVMDIQKQLPALKLKAHVESVRDAGFQGMTDQIQKLTDTLKNFHANSSSATRENEALTKSMKSQSVVVDQLRNQLASYFSIYMAKRFLGEIVQIGGEFEKQRIALRSIIGEAQKADVLYAKIKVLAVKSPFEFGDLASYTKQLTAFSIPYNELYDTTKRLADISAGLGVDMSRLILAYGQVRSAAFLRGQEVRQFTEAGIPIVDELAKKISALEGRAVSAGEVFERISKRMISFQMVKDVLFDLTNEGGKFFEMQEVLAESLAGKMANLKDAYDIMLSEMADGNSGVLKGSIDLLTRIMENWRSVGTVILWTVSAYSAAKMSIIAYNAAQAASIVLKGGLTKASLAQTAATLKETAATVGLTAAQKGALSMSGKLSGLMTNANLWVAGVTALTAAFGAVYAYYREATRVSRELRETTENAAGRAAALSYEYEQLVRKLGTVERGTNAYAEIIREINRRYGDYLPNILSESAAYDEVTKSLQATTEAIYAKAKADAYEQGQEKITTKFGEDIKESTNKLKDNIKVALHTTEEDAATIATNIRHRMQEAFQQGIRVDARWIDKELKKVDERFASLMQNALDPVNASISLGTVLKAAKKVAGAYEDQLELQEEQRREMEMLFGVSSDYAGEMEKIRQSEIDLEEGLSKLKIGDLEAEKKLTEEIYQSRRDSYKKVGDEANVRMMDELIAKLHEGQKKWVAMAESAANAEKMIGGQLHKVAVLVPSDEEQKNQVKYLNRISDLYREIKGDIADLNMVSKDMREQDWEDNLAGLLFKKQQFDLLAKDLHFSYDDFGKGEKGEKGGSDKDPVAEEAKRRIDLWKEAMSVYEKYVSLIGKDRATGKVRADVRFEKLDFDPDKYQSALQNIYDRINGNGADRQKIKDSITGLFTDLDAKAVRESIGDLMKEIENELSEASKKWKAFDSIKSVAGKEVALQIVFGGDTNLDGYIDEYAQKIKALASSDAFKIKIDFEVQGDSLIRDQIGDIYKSLPEGLRKHVDELDKIRQEDRQKMMDNYADLLSGTKSYEQRRAEVVEKYASAIAESSGVVKAALTRMRDESLSKISVDEIKNSDVIIRLMEDLKYYSTASIRAWVDSAKQLIRESDNLTLQDKKYLIKLIRNGTDEIRDRNPFKALKEAYEDYKKAIASGDEDAIREANAHIAKTSEKAVASMNRLSSSAREALTILGEADDRTTGLMTAIFDFAVTAADGIAKTAGAAAQSLSALEKASVILAIIGAAIQLITQLNEVGYGNSNAQYKKYAEKVALVNSMTTAVNNYKLAVAKAAKEEATWFGESGLRDLGEQLKISSQARENYFSKLHEQQAVYEDEKAGGWFAAVSRVLAKGYEHTVGKPAEFLLGDFGGDVAKVGGGISSWGVTTTRVDDYDKRNTEAQNNLRFETRKKTSGFLGIGGKSQRTVDLREWAKENLGMDLFDEDGWINTEMARELLTTYGDKLVGETKETLEYLVEMKEQYDQYQKDLREYVSSLYSPLVDNFVDALWDWLDNGKDALDSFKDYASNTFREIVSEMMKTIVLKTLFGGYEEKIAKEYDEFLQGKISEEELMNRITDHTAELAEEAGVLLPMMEQGLAGIADKLLEAGIDIRQPDESGKKAGLSAGITQITEDTANLLASYIDAIRADVSRLRELQEMYANRLIEMYGAMNNTLALIQADIALIQQNTLRSANMTEEIRDLLYSVSTGTKKLYIA